MGMCDDLCEHTGDCCCDKEKMWRLIGQEWTDLPQEPPHQEGKDFPQEPPYFKKSYLKYDMTGYMADQPMVGVMADDPMAGYMADQPITDQPMCSNEGTCKGRCGGGSDLDCW